MPVDGLKAKGEEPLPASVLKKPLGQNYQETKRLEEQRNRKRRLWEGRLDQPFLLFLGMKFHSNFFNPA